MPIRLLIISVQIDCILLVSHKPSISNFEIRNDLPASSNGYHKKVTSYSKISGRRTGGNAVFQSASQPVGNHLRKSLKQTVIDKKIQNRDAESQKSNVLDMEKHTIRREYDYGDLDYNGSTDAPIVNLNNIKLHFNISGPLERMKQELLDVMTEKEGRQLASR